MEQYHCGCIKSLTDGWAQYIISTLVEVTNPWPFQKQSCHKLIIHPSEQRTRANTDPFTYIIGSPNHKGSSISIPTSTSPLPLDLFSTLTLQPHTPRTRIMIIILLYRDYVITNTTYKTFNMLQLPILMYSPGFTACTDVIDVSLAAFWG